MEQHLQNAATELPANLHAELTILGACLVDTVAIVDASTGLSPSDLYLDSHRKIFSAVLALHNDNLPVDLVTIADYLKKHRELDSVGGLPYLASLTEGLPRKLSVESYVRIVADAARRRDIFKLAENISQRVLGNEEEAASILNNLKRWTSEIEEDTGDDKPMQSVAQYLAETYAEEERVFDLDPREQGISSGFPWQDDKTGGYIAGKLYILAARPGMGKTAKLVNDVCNISLKSKQPVALFTFEQSKTELLQRLLCCRATASLTDYIKGKSEDGDKDAIRKAYRDYKAAPLYWDDSPGLTVSKIRAKCIRLIKKLALEGKELTAIFIDQLSFLSWDDIWEKGQRTDQLIGTMTRNLKKLGRELGVAVILLCQLGRGSTKNKDAKPSLADLKESGSIEENADVVAFLHRAEYYDRTDESLRGKGEYIIAKQKQGPVGSHVMQYLATSCKWIDKWEPKDGDNEDSQIPW